MTKTLHAAYEGSGSVRIGERLFSYPNRNKGDGYGGVMPKTARTLIREGVDPETLVHLTRDGTNVFAKDWSLREWASIEFTEPDSAKHSVRARKYRPHSSERITLAGGGRVPQEAQGTPALVQTHP